MSDKSKADAFYARSLTFYSKACDSGKADACDKIGDAYDYGRVFAQDQAKAALFYAKACDGGNRFACNSLGSKYQLGLRVEKDIEKAKIYFEKLRTIYAKGCDSSDGDLCFLLAYDYDNGREGNDMTTVDKRKAVLYYTKMGASIYLSPRRCGHFKRYFDLILFTF